MQESNYQEQDQMNESRMTSASALKNLDQYPEEELVDMINQFDELRISAQEERRYLDADKAKKKITQQTAALETRRKYDIKMKHNVERSKLDEEFSNELDQFNYHWDEKIQKYKEECTKLEELQLNKQQQDFDQYQASLEENLPSRPKDGPKVLEFKKQIELQANNQDYEAAHQIQQKMLKLSQEEESKFQYERDNKIRHLIEQFANKQKNEHSSLRKKIITGLEELEIKREKEYEMLLHKFNNLKSQIESSQNTETRLFEKSKRSTNKLRQSVMSNYDKYSQSQSGNNLNSSMRSTQNLGKKTGTGGKKNSSGKKKTDLIYDKY